MKAFSAFAFGAASLALATPPDEHKHGPPDGRGRPPWAGKPHPVTIIHTTTVWTTAMVCPESKPNCPYSQMEQTSECITKTNVEIVASSIDDTTAATSSVQQVQTGANPLPAPSSASSSGSSAPGAQFVVDAFGNTRPAPPIIPTFPTTSTGPHAPPSRTDSLPGAASVITNEAISGGVPSQPVITNEAIDTGDSSGVNPAPAATGVAGSQPAASASGSAAPGAPQPVPAPTAGSQIPGVGGVAPSSGSVASGVSQGVGTGVAGVPPGQFSGVPSVPAPGASFPTLGVSGSAGAPAGQTTGVSGAAAPLGSASLVTGPDGGVSTVIPAGQNTGVSVGQTTGGPGAAASFASASLVTGADGSVSTVVPAGLTTGVAGAATSLGLASLITGPDGSVSIIVPTGQTTGVSVGQTSGVSAGQSSAGAVPAAGSSGSIAAGSVSAASGVPSAAIPSGSTVINGVTIPIPVVPVSASAVSGVPSAAAPSGSTVINGITVPIPVASDVVASSGLSSSAGSASGASSANSASPPAPSGSASDGSIGNTPPTVAVPPSTGAVPVTSAAPQTSALSGPSAVGATIPPAPTGVPALTSGSVISSSSSSNASDILWDTLFLSNNFWQGGQQTIGCPESAPGCCVKLPASQLTSTQVLSYAPLETFVWVVEGGGDWSTAGSWDLPDEAGGEITVCSYASDIKATQKRTVLTVPAKTITKVNFGEMCNEHQTESGVRFLDPCKFATVLPPRVTATLGAREIWQQPLGMRGGKPEADPAQITFAACESGTKWVVQPQPTQSFACSMSLVGIADKSQGNECVEGSTGCIGGTNLPDADNEEGGDDDDDDSDVDFGALFGFCKPKGLFNLFAALECTCGIFGCDGGCGILGCSRGPCGVIGQIPLVGGLAGGLLGAFGLCEPKCQFPCGFGGGVRWPPLPRPPGQPKPTQQPTSQPTDPSTSNKSRSESGSTSSSSCSEEAATITYVSRFTDAATTSCKTTYVVTRGCSVTPTATTKFCSASTATQVTVFCASSGTSGTCLSTSSVASTVISGCDVTATTTTTHGPACPAQMTLTPDDAFEGAGGYENEVPRTWGSADPSCELAATADRTVLMDTILKPQIEDFCSKPSDPYIIPGISDAGGSSDAAAYQYWEHHCTFGDDEKSVLGIAVASSPECQENKFSKEDCQKQLTAIADKCVSTDDKNNKIAGDVYDQKCFGYGIAVYTHEAGEKPPKCITTTAKPSSIPTTDIPHTDDKNSAKAWKFQLGLQWAKVDYDDNAKDRLVWGFYGARTDTDMETCDFYWAVAGNQNADKPGYGEGKSFLELASKEGLVGDLKNLVDNSIMLVHTLPNSVGKDGSGKWPTGSLNMGGACNRECRLTRSKDLADHLYVSCIASSPDCKEIQEVGLATLANNVKVDYRCAQIGEPKQTSCDAKGSQLGSIVGSNKFLAMWTCEYKYEGSGVRKVEDEVAEAVASKSMSAVAAAASSASAAWSSARESMISEFVATLPKPTPEPTQPAKKDSFRDLEVTFVYQWLQGNYDDNFGFGFVQMYGHKRREEYYPDCEFLEQKPGAAFGFVEQPTEELWIGHTIESLKDYIDGGHGKPRQPIPRKMPYKSDKYETLSWPANKCMRECEMKNAATDTEWSHLLEPDKLLPNLRVACRNPDKDCEEQPPHEGMEWHFVCMVVRPTLLTCGKGESVYYSPSIKCSGNDEMSDWFPYQPMATLR